MFKYLWMPGAPPVRLPAPRSLGGAPLPVSITWSCRVILNGSSVACEITTQRYKKSWNIPFSIYSTYRTTKNLEKDETKKWEIEWKRKKREREKKEKEWSVQRARNSQDILRFRVGWYSRESHGATYNDPRGSSNRGLFEIPVFTLIPNVAETRGE